MCVCVCVCVCVCFSPSPAFRGSQWQFLQISFYDSGPWDPSRNERSQEKRCVLMIRLSDPEGLGEKRKGRDWNAGPHWEGLLEPSPAFKSPRPFSHPGFQVPSGKRARI